MSDVERAGADGVGVFPHSRLGRRLVRVRARVRRTALDAALIAGADPWASPELMVRAAALTTPEERRKVALGLETLVRCAEHGRSLSRYLSVRERAVLREREALEELVRRLRGAPPVPAGVVAQLEWLLWNGCSPAYAGGESPELIAVIAERCLEATD
jgi:hypothetical protein